MQKAVATTVAVGNEEATEAWSGVLFDRFVKYRDLVVAGLKAHGDAAMELHPPATGDRVLDIGCGFGDTTQQLAALVGHEGHAAGVDVSEPFISASIDEARRAGVENVEFFATDVQVGDLRGPYDYAFSRMGVMFFANPVQALRNIRGALRPGGRLVAVVWRRKLDNEWLHRAEQVVEQYLEEPEEPEDVRCGPGPFSMANADTVSEQLQIAGFERPTFTRCDLPIKIGDDLDHAVEFNMAIGPAAELLRICPADEVDRLRPKLEREIRAVLQDYVEGDGVSAQASTWIISARVPA
ncbi:MAG TPA: methyltransferase domain-containing protein [Solirubrobacterales bacterium]|nr:methyltransferase domain-containing protein [Solirubrobacterales bacterium]